MNIGIENQVKLIKIIVLNRKNIKIDKHTYKEKS